MSQFVIGGTQNTPVAFYNVTASGPVTIQQLTFSVSGIGITAVIAGGVTFPVVNGVATASGLNMPVPQGYAGLAIPVSVNYAQVGVNGVPSGNTNYITLSSIKYINSSGVIQTLPTAVNSNIMELVGGSPVVSLIATQNSLSTGLVKVGSISVSANSLGGNIKVTSLPITLNIAGGVISTSTSVSLYDETTGQTVPVTLGTMISGYGGSTTLILNSNNTITPGTPHVYDVFVPVLAVPGAAGSATLSLSMPSAANFAFTDINGGATGITGAGSNGTPVYIVNYPTNSVSIHN
jgi:hypothetical protein